MNKLKSFIQEHSELKVICFDIFDTIISRTVSPEYVKTIWAKRLSIVLGNQIGYGKLYTFRNQIESAVCAKNQQQGFDVEFKYEQLVDELYLLLHNQKLINRIITNQEFKFYCTSIELEIEKSVQIIDPDWLEIILYIKKHTNLQVYFVSDFYLTSDILNELLEFHRIMSYADEIIVSSDYLLTKRSGNLYDFILNKYQLSPSSALMVGDNEYSDIQMSKAKGIKAYHLDREKQHGIYKSFEKKYLNSITFRNSLVSLEKNLGDKIPFQKIIFSLFQFIVRLHTELTLKKVKNVFFLSREGEFLCKLFNLYQQAEGYSNFMYITPHYLKVSRKSTFLPSLRSLEVETFDILFRQYRKISVSDFLLSIGLGNYLNDFKKILQLDFDKKEEDFPTSKAFKLLFKNPVFKEKYELKRNDQKTNFIGYINQFNADIMSEGISLVDVGWKGTIQDNIFRIFDSELDVTGYYLGLVAPGDLQIKNGKKGLVFSAIPDRTQYYSIYNENRAIFEIVLGASHGSANHYINNNDVIEVETIQELKESELYLSRILPMQTKMTETFQELCHLFSKKSVDIEEMQDIFAKIHAKIVFTPSEAEIAFFNGLYHYENFGFFQFTTFNSSTKINIIQRVKNIIKFLRNPKKFFENSFWPPVTLNNAGLGYLKKIYGTYRLRKQFK